MNIKENSFCGPKLLQLRSQNILNIAYFDLLKCESHLQHLVEPKIEPLSNASYQVKETRI